jgi:TolA-binding protein
LAGGSRRSQDTAFLSEVHYQLGFTYLKQGKDDNARGEFVKSVSVNPGSFSSYQARIEEAQLEARAGSLDKARELLTQVIQDRNDELAAQAQKVLGDIYFNVGDYQEALTNYLRVKYVYQSYPAWVATALYSAGNTYEKLGQTDEAKKVYQEIISKYPAEKISEKAKERLAAL